jgi:hypothetical protein
MVSDQGFKLVSANDLRSARTTGFAVQLIARGKLLLFRVRARACLCLTLRTQLDFAKLHGIASHIASHGTVRRVGKGSLAAGRARRAAPNCAKPGLVPQHPDLTNPT